MPIGIENPNEIYQPRNLHFPHSLSKGFTDRRTNILNCLFALLLKAEKENGMFQ